MTETTVEELVENARKAQEAADAAQLALIETERRQTAERAERGAAFDRSLVEDYDPNHYAEKVRTAREALSTAFAESPLFAALVDYHAATHERYLAAVYARDARARLDGQIPTAVGVQTGDEFYIDRLTNLISRAVVDRTAEYQDQVETARSAAEAGS